MPENKFTPGPWEVSPKDQMRVNVALNSFLHPTLPRIATEEDLEQMAVELERLRTINAELLAALECLIDSVPYMCDAESCDCGDGDTPDCEHIQAHKAIAKAKEQS